MVICFCPVCASHTLPVLSKLPEAMRLPSGENAALMTQLVCPLRVSCSCPVCASHTFTVSSKLPATMRLPSGLNATLETGLRWPLRVSCSFPDCAFHTFTSGREGGVLSSSHPELPDAMRLPSGENATLLTPPVWPLRE